MSGKLDISLSNTNKSLDLNNSNDASNIDMVLSLIVENKENQDRLKNILENTSIKYLRRLHNDGLIVDKGGPKIVPIFNPVVLEKAMRFRMAGGYSSLLDRPNWFAKWWWAVVVPLALILAGLLIEYKWFK